MLLTEFQAPSATGHCEHSCLSIHTNPKTQGLKLALAATTPTAGHNSITGMCNKSVISTISASFFC